MAHANPDTERWTDLWKTAYATARGLLGPNHPDLDDVAQEAACRVVRAPRFDPRRPEARAFIATTARHIVYDHFRRRRPTDELTYDIAAPERPDVAEEYGLMLRALLRVPPRNRVLFILDQGVRPLDGDEELVAFEALFAMPYSPGWRESGRAALARRAGLTYDALNQLVHRVRDELRSAMV